MYISGKKTPTATTALDDGTMLDILLLGRSKLSTYYLLIVSVSQEKAVPTTKSMEVWNLDL